MLSTLSIIKEVECDFFHDFLSKMLNFLCAKLPFQRTYFVHLSVRMLKPIRIPDMVSSLSAYYVYHSPLTFLSFLACCHSKSWCQPDQTCWPSQVEKKTEGHLCSDRAFFFIVDIGAFLRIFRI